MAINKWFVLIIGFIVMNSILFFYTKANAMSFGSFVVSSVIANTGLVISIFSFKKSGVH
jgi:hypothetical protein